MTPTHADSPLRRSEVGAVRTAVQTPIINDDDAERRLRRRTVIDDTSASSIEQSENLKDCLKIYHENKLSKENAWSVSLIDTLSTLLDKHHKSLNNFKVAGSSLEASTKVYGLRVDSIHTDVVRLASGLNKKRFVEEDEDDNGGADESTVQRQDNGEATDEQSKKPRKRVRKAVSTITKNKETLNGRLDTNPFIDPIFAKLNTIPGSINSSSRLLQNILPSTNSKLGLRMDNPFWDSQPREPISDQLEYDYSKCKSCPGGFLESITKESPYLRPNLTGYVICDTPAEQDENEDIPEDVQSNNEQNTSEMAVAFDINAEVEPIQPDNHTFVDVDMEELQELTIEEQAAINHCRELRRAPIVIDDMRPIDSRSSQLEYSYRPLDKISQFWAGPSHWKFKRGKGRSLTVIREASGSNTVTARGQKRARGKNSRESNYVPFDGLSDNLFKKETEVKIRKANVQKKWDAKKLKLPNDAQISRDILNEYTYAPGIPVYEEINESACQDLPDHDSYDYRNGADQEYCSNMPIDADSDLDRQSAPGSDSVRDQTVAEIATHFIGAPDKVTKIIVPFAKRAKVIDMKQLKKCCTQLIDKQLVLTEKENIPQHLLNNNDAEKYKHGTAKFTKIYKTLPQMLSQSMSDSLSPSVAFYSILHLANETGLRLVPQNDLSDFTILQIDS